jgi:hypothetical protein
MWAYTFADHRAGHGGGGFLGGAVSGIQPFQQGGAFPQMGRHRMNTPHFGLHIIHAALTLRMTTC